jgi:hypothetical protein
VSPELLNHRRAIWRIYCLQVACAQFDKRCAVNVRRKFVALREELPFVDKGESVLASGV